MINIAVLGCGVVGSGVCRLIKANATDIESRLGDTLVVKKVLELVPQRALDLGFHNDQICSTIEEILADEDIHIIVETMGGTDTAFQYNIAAMKSGRHIVTSNKDLVELRWNELYELAAEHGVGFYFEGAVGGGIPVIHPIKTSLAANRINRIVGILNGTSNYILSKMYHEGLTYEQALARAQQHGFAENDPTNDVEGYDAARKLAILSRLSYNTKISLPDIHTEGITQIDAFDIDMAREMGYTIKLLALSERKETGIAASVRPAFVPISHPLAGVDREYNAVFITGDACGDIMLYGKGAGSMPTASAVVGDTIVAARGVIEGRKRVPSAICYEELPIVPVDETINSYYLHMTVLDKPLVLAGISTALGESEVSMASLVQRPNEDGTATLFIITHPAKEADVQDAVQKLLAADVVSRVTTMVCLPEQEGTR